MGIELQYQLSNGEWVGCEEQRTEEFLNRCETHNGMVDGKIVPRFRASAQLSRADVLAALSGGKILRNDTNDWYSKCRAKPSAKPRRERKMAKCSCGCTVDATMVMSASMGTACPDCYDRMSD